MLKYVKKFTLDILPSVAATIIGAYIVNHYIIAKPAADTAAAVSTANPKAEAKVLEPGSDVANIPEAGVRAKGISEKAVMEKAAVADKPAEKAADKPSETASVPADSRKHQPAPREKAVAKAGQTPPTVAPVVTEPAAPPPVEAAVAPAPERDANDLARAAIERLRGSNESPARSQETRAPEAPRVIEMSRTPETTRAPETPRVAAAPAIQPLPPPIMVSTPAVEVKPPYASAMRSSNSGRLTPPADIPSPPLDLRAEAAGPSMRERTSVAEDVLSAAKSVFHAVLPR